MDLKIIARTIQLIIAPAVIITSCCILGSGLLEHYSSIGERLRVAVSERADLLKETKSRLIGLIQSAKVAWQT